MKETDQYMFMFPKMFISLISSALNEMLESLYWIIKNNKLDIAKPLFKHFLAETESIFKSDNPYGSELLDNVSPLIYDLYRRHFVKDITLPYNVHPSITYDPRKRSDAVNKAIMDKKKEIDASCVPYSKKDKLPACFFHIIDAILLFPQAPELADITSDLSDSLSLGKSRLKSLTSPLMPCELFMEKILRMTTQVCIRLLLLQASTGTIALPQDPARKTVINTATMRM